MSRVYIYVVVRDFGFAPNPFHGYCTLATCKPNIRSTANVDDWIFGVGGSRLKATGQCVFSMKVTEKMTFNDYWTDRRFHDKKPVRNGSKTMVVGDNIYYHHKENGKWSQAHSHHSEPDGRINHYNLDRDTKSDNVLISEHFYYFGKEAPEIPGKILSDLGYENKIGHRVYAYETAKKLVAWVETKFQANLNIRAGLPYDFDQSDAHYSVETNKLKKATK